MVRSKASVGTNKVTNGICYGITLLMVHIMQMVFIIILQLTSAVMQSDYIAKNLMLQHFITHCYTYLIQSVSELLTINTSSVPVYNIILSV